MPRLKKSCLVDVNVWIALAYDLHVHHPVARKWFDGLEVEQALFCRLTQLGFLRLLTNRKVMRDDAMNQLEAWKTYDRALRDSRVGFASEAPQLEPDLRRLTKSAFQSTNLWTDAYLAAFASTSGVQRGDLGQGFRGYERRRNHASQLNPHQLPRERATGRGPSSFLARSSSSSRATRSFKLAKV